MIFDAYNQDDEVAKKVIARFKDYLAKGIANIVNTIDPGIIAIGGGVSKAEDRSSGYALCLYGRRSSVT